MCGIAGIIVKKQGQRNTHQVLSEMSLAIKHRGPDGEGFMLADKEKVLPYFREEHSLFQKRQLNYIPKSELPTQSDSTRIAFAHRRLAILDLSESGHQPMCDVSGELWITYNGEVYNFHELRVELETLGHSFISRSDTEVVLHAYREWGSNCVKHFNGMWAFCIFDKKNNICFASRDRFGVKPFYYSDNNEHFAFASEQKAFIKAGVVRASVSTEALSNYLINGAMEYEAQNFFEGICELLPGQNLIYNLSTHEFRTEKYFDLDDTFSLENDQLAEKQLIDKVTEVFENAVKLRLRSDVPVGTCLSGGIDSSALALTMAEQTSYSVFCFTSVFKNQLFNEEKYADEVAQKIGAKHFKVEPTVADFAKDIDELIYSQDVPIWSTSTYAQHSVMALARKNNIKVVLDGQGADELFGGYHHHFIAKWNNLFSQGKYMAALSDIRTSSKTIPNPFLFYFKEKTKAGVDLKRKQYSNILTQDFILKSHPENPVVYFNDVNQQLAHDIKQTRLKAFLKCEDRCGMWHSVESRTPFSDDLPLIKLMFSFHGNKKIKNGISKYLLREALKDKLPKSIYGRYDKIGFETPMQQWMVKLQDEMLTEIRSSNFDFIKQGALAKLNPLKNVDQQLLFKLYVFARWQKLFK